MKKEQILSGYTDEQGRFSRLPGKRQKKKLDLMLEVLSNAFTYNYTYNETEINEILNKHHTFSDPATLRRLLFGCGYLDRSKDGSAYWKVTTDN